MDPTLERIYAELQTIQEQLRRMTDKINESASEHGQALVKLEAGLASHKSEANLKHEQLTERIGKAKSDIDEAFKKIKAFEDAQQQLEGARKVWIAVTALAGAVILGIELWAHLGGH